MKCVWGWVTAILLVVSGCGGSGGGDTLPQTVNTGVVGGQNSVNSPEYVLGPGDSITINVWKHPELSTTVPIRPDGRYSSPLIEDMQAAGKTPTQLGKDVADKLRTFVQDPIVTVIVNGIGSVGNQNIKVLGQAVRPISLPYSTGMTVLDVMVAVGGLTEFADGNGSKIVRRTGSGKKAYRIRLGDLLNGDISADRPVLPGDTIIIPESFF